MVRGPRKEREERGFEDWWHRRIMHVHATTLMHAGILLCLAGGFTFVPAQLFKHGMHCLIGGSSSLQHPDLLHVVRLHHRPSLPRLLLRAVGWLPRVCVCVHVLHADLRGFRVVCQPLRMSLTGFRVHKVLVEGWGDSQQCKERTIEKPRTAWCS